MFTEPDANIFYVHADIDLAALPTSVVAVRLNQPIENKDLLLYRGAKVKKYLDYLHDTKAIDYYHEYVYPQRINVRGHRKSCRHSVDRVIPHLMLLTKTRPTLIRYTPYTPVSFQYPAEYVIPQRDVGTRIARLIGWYIRLQDAQLKWHGFHPQFDWYHNGGGLTAPHATACLEYGIIPYYHYVETLKRVPLMWLRSIKNKKPHEIELRDYVTHPPGWWNKLFNNVGFFHFMDTEEREQAEALVSSKCPKVFQTGFLSYYAPKRHVSIRAAIL